MLKHIRSITLSLIALFAQPADACAIPAGVADGIDQADAIFSGRIEDAFVVTDPKGAIQYSVLDIAVSEVFLGSVGDHQMLAFSSNGPYYFPKINTESGLLIFTAIKPNQPGRRVVTNGTYPKNLPKGLLSGVEQRCDNLAIYEYSSLNSANFRKVAAGTDPKTLLWGGSNRILRQIAEPIEVPKITVPIEVPKMRHAAASSKRGSPATNKIDAVTAAIICVALALCTFVLYALWRRFRQIEAES